MGWQMGDAGVVFARRAPGFGVGDRDDQIAGLTQRDLEQVQMLMVHRLEPAGDASQPC